MKNKLQVYYLIFLLAMVSCKNNSDFEWAIYGGNNTLNRYSPLSQIDTNNVKNLKVAWVYNSRDTGMMEINPLIVNKTLYGVTSHLKLFAVNAITGEEKWKYDPAVDFEDTDGKREGFGINACRGIAYYKEKNNQEDRIFYTVGSDLYCINASTGKLIKNFGKNGKLSLYENLSSTRDISKLRVTSTSPGTIYKDLIIIGTSLSENEEAAPGHIRAYDVHSGRLRWKFNTIPHPGEIGFESWEDTIAYKYVGGANAWSGFSLDEKRGIVYASTGTSNPDFYGGNRKGDNLFANSIIALNALTGKIIWNYQTVHHDLWDYDLATPGILVTIKKEGRKVDGIVQLTKHGFIFLLDRETGKPIYPIIEKPVESASELEGESLSPTQPFPTFFEPYIRQGFGESDLIDDLISDSSREELRARFRRYKSGAIFVPPTIRGTVVLPGFEGGVNWGGGSFDPETGILYFNAKEMPWIVTMEEVKDGNMTPFMLARVTNLQAGKRLYKSNCSGCHGLNREGGGDAPSLINIGKKYSTSEFESIVNNGRRMMPAFSFLNKAEKDAIASFVLNLEKKQKEKFKQEERKVTDSFYLAPYKNTGIKQFRTIEGYPAISPPWGHLNAINLNTGQIEWKNTFGDYPDILKEKGIKTGGASSGGSIVTAGGILFIGASRDEKFRAYNKKTGELIFETELPAGGYATPSVYSINGKEFIAIACGGGRFGTKGGDSIVAFSLSDK